MPNWCTNTISMKGIASLPLYTVKDGVKHLDFEKITPMPETIRNTESGTRTSLAMTAWDTKKLTTNLANHSSHLIKWLSEMPADELDKYFHEGKKYYDNIEKYGAPTWYEWACLNWGTKWNACDTEILSPNKVRIETAWCPPHQYLLTLSCRYPDKQITCRWHEEGGTSGSFKLKNGARLD